MPHDDAYSRFKKLAEEIDHLISICPCSVYAPCITCCALDDALLSVDVKSCLAPEEK